MLLLFIKRIPNIIYRIRYYVRTPLLYALCMPSVHTYTRKCWDSTHGLIDLMTTDNTGEDKNSIATFGTRNNARARHVQEVGDSFPQYRRGYFVIGAYTIISACFLTT